MRIENILWVLPQDVAAVAWLVLLVRRRVAVELVLIGACYPSKTKLDLLARKTRAAARSAIDAVCPKAPPFAPYWVMVYRLVELGQSTDAAV